MIQRAFIPNGNGSAENRLPGVLNKITFNSFFSEIQQFLNEILVFFAKDSPM
jgi:hypothetical protein